MTSNYAKNRLRAQINNYEPTKTDQSQRDQTDLNIIVKAAGVHGQMPVSATEPVYADFTALPDGLKGFLDLNRRTGELRRELPEALQNIPTEVLTSTPPRELEAIIKNYDTAKERRAKLPAHLQRLPDSSILALTTEQMENIINPTPKPAPPPEPPK